MEKSDEGKEEEEGRWGRGVDQWEEMGGEGRGRSGDKPRCLVWRQSWWEESEMRDSYSVIMTQETGRREGWRDTSPEEAGPLSVLISAVAPPSDFIRQPAAAECFYHSKVTAAQ